MQNPEWHPEYNGPYSIVTITEIICIQFVACVAFPLPPFFQTCFVMQINIIAHFAQTESELPLHFFPIMIRFQPQSMAIRAKLAKVASSSYRATSHFGKNL